MHGKSLGIDRDIFVEYFGLMDRAEYAKKADQKKVLLKASGISLVFLFPQSWRLDLLEGLREESVPGEKIQLLRGHLRLK